MVAGAAAGGSGGGGGGVAMEGGEKRDISIPQRIIVGRIERWLAALHLDLEEYALGQCHGVEATFNLCGAFHRG